MVQFCGHRLHVHSSFQLFLTTTAVPTSISPSVASEVCVISFSSSLPLAEDILTDTTFNVATGNIDHCIEVSTGVASFKEELRSLDGELFEKLPMNAKEGCYWWSTEKISNIVSKKNEVYHTCM